MNQRSITPEENTHKKPLDAYLPWNQLQDRTQQSSPWRFGRASNIFPNKPQRATDTTKAEARVRKLARKSEEVLYRLKTVFPFDFFPDTLTINSNKLDINSSYFFFSHQTQSIPLRDIGMVEVQTSLLFATLKIINLRYPLEPVEINFLWNHEAEKAKQIIDGLLVTMSHGADVAAIEPQRMLKQLEKVGASYA